MDNKRKPGSPGRDRVNIRAGYEVQYRTKALEASHEKLEDVVRLVGTSAAQFGNT
jgi:hypothetical protein